MRFHAFLLVFVAACSSGGSGGGTGLGDGGAGSSGTSGTTSGGTSGAPGGGGTTLGPSFDALTGTANTFGCSAGFPIQTNPSFPQPFYQAGQQSCLVLTFVADPSKVGTLKSGTATTATIRVGATTGPMRFVRMRILYNRTTGPKCCSLEQYGDTFTPTANSDTTVNLNFPITLDPTPAQDDLETTAANDLVALEVLSGNVPIPGSWPNNGGAVEGTASYMWLPALSARGTPAPSNQLLQYEGSYSGFVPAFNYQLVSN